MSNKTDENRKKTTGSGKHPAHWSGVFAMTLCVFALIASEFMPVSLLTPMAQTMHVTEGMAGQGIAISGAFAVVTSLFISVLAGTLNRKTLLLGLTCIMAISGAVIAMAPNYLTYMAGRSLIGIVVGGFWSMSAATAMRLVPVHRVPLALAIFNSGNALATVVAASGQLARIGGWLAGCLLLPGAGRHHRVCLAITQSAFHAGHPSGRGFPQRIHAVSSPGGHAGHAGCGDLLYGAIHALYLHQAFP